MEPPKGVKAKGGGWGRGAHVEKHSQIADKMTTMISCFFSTLSHPSSHIGGVGLSSLWIP